MYYLSSMGMTQKMACVCSFTATAVMSSLENLQWHGRDPRNLHVPLQELQLRFSLQAGDRGLCHGLYVSLKNKISDRKTVNRKQNFCMLPATKGFQFNVMEMKVTDKNQCILGNCTSKNVQIRYTQNIQFLLPRRHQKKTGIRRQSSCYCFHI